MENTSVDGGLVHGEPKSEIRDWRHLQKWNVTDGGLLLVWGAAGRRNENTQGTVEKIRI